MILYKELSTEQNEAALAERDVVEKNFCADIEVEVMLVCGGRSKNG